MRTALNGANIIALAEDFTRHNEKIAETVERVRERAKHITDIVRTQKEIGGEARDRKDLNLQHAISSAIRVLQDSLAKRSINIAVDCENAPEEIQTQESLFHQMIVNLVKNAIEAIDDLAASAKGPPCASC